MQKDKLEKKEAALRGEEEEIVDEGWDGMIGPVNTTAVSESVVGLVPSPVRDESAEVWLMCSEVPPR